MLWISWDLRGVSTSAYMVAALIPVLPCGDADPLAPLVQDQAVSAQDSHPRGREAARPGRRLSKLESASGHALASCAGRVYGQLSSEFDPMQNLPVEHWPNEAYKRLDDPECPASSPPLIRLDPAQLAQNVNPYYVAPDIGIPRRRCC